MAFKMPEKYRVRRSVAQDGPFGAMHGVFNVPRVTSRGTHFLTVIASIHEDGWEHVSVSLRDRCPTWEEMCLVKDLFWDAEDAVIQVHPPKSEYCNFHKYCLHLWRNPSVPFPRPHASLY